MANLGKIEEELACGARAAHNPIEMGLTLWGALSLWARAFVVRRHLISCCIRQRKESCVALTPSPKKLSLETIIFRFSNSMVS